MRSKELFFTLFIALLFGLDATSQSTTTRVIETQEGGVEFKMSETDSLYQIAFDNYVEHIINDDLEKSPLVLHIEYQRYCSMIGTKQKEYEVIWLRKNNRKKEIRKNDNDLTYIQINALSFQNGEFHISIVPFKATIKWGRINLSYSMTYTTYFKLNNNELIVDRFESNGI